MSPKRSALTDLTSTSNIQQAPRTAAKSSSLKRKADELDLDSDDDFGYGMPMDKSANQGEETVEHITHSY